MDFQIDAGPEALDSAPLSADNPSRRRLTPARQTVIRILRGTDRALTHHDIERQARADGIQFDRVTLYRALEWLVNQRLANKVAAEDRVWRFSAAREGELAQAYFHCTACNVVFCLEVPAGDAAIALPDGFRAQRTEIMVRGECGPQDCKH